MSAEFLDSSVRYDTNYRPANVAVTSRSLAKLQRSDDTDAVGARAVPTGIPRAVPKAVHDARTDMRQSNGFAPDDGPMATELDRVRGVTVSDEVTTHDEYSAPVSWLGCSVAKLLEICVASSIHTAVWVVLLLWIDLLYASHIFSGQSIADTAFACLFVWISTFTCFYALVEDDN